MSLVLTYHAISDGSKEQFYDPVYAITPEEFKRHVNVICDRDMQIASLRQRLSSALSEEDRTIYFTFDDGHISNYWAGRYLVEQGHSADFFVNPGLIGSPHLMSWDQITELSNLGISIQSHGMSHRYFDEMTPATILQELETSKKTIEDKTSVAVEIFAPPGGRINRRVEDIALDLGYRIVCNSMPGKIGSNPMKTPRIMIQHHCNQKVLRQYLEKPGIHIARAKSKYYLLYGLKRTLGNSLYETLRSKLLRAG